MDECKRGLWLWNYRDVHLLPAITYSQKITIEAVSSADSM